MNIETQLEFEIGFTESEKHLAHYILAKQKAILPLSVQELAKLTYTSPATVVRFTKKLGLKGYNDFKIKYSAELEAKYHQGDIDVNFPFSKDDDEKAVARKLAELGKETLDHTLSVIEYDDMRKAVMMMREADKIDLYGTDNSLLAAEAFANKMTRIGKEVATRLFDGSQIFLASASNKEHLAIIISYSGETDMLIRCARVLKKKKTPIIAITSIGDNQLSHYSTLTLTLDSREKIYNKVAPFSSLLSMNYLLDLLYALFFKENYDQNLIEKVTFDRATDGRRPLLSPVNERDAKSLHKKKK